MGDDLEDDFVPGGDEYLSSGEDEDNTTGLGGDPDVDGEGIVPDSRSDSPLVAGGKRKASDDEDGSDSEEDVTVDNGPKTGAGGKELTAEERKKEKKRRNKEKLKEKKVRSHPPPSRSLILLGFPGKTLTSKGAGPILILAETATERVLLDRLCARCRVVLVGQRAQRPAGQPASWAV